LISEQKGSPRLAVSENKLLKRIFGPMIGRMGGGRELFNEEYND
jgi:hypothetical protein